jgi:hypothetical protein
VPILKNQRWEIFAQEIAKGETATKAYITAGFRPSRKNASRLKTSEDINARVQELQAVAAHSVSITVESICRELDEANSVARERGQASAMVSASALRAKLAGLMVEKVEVGSPGDFDNLETPEAVAEEMARLFTGDRTIELSPEQSSEFTALVVEYVDAIHEFLAAIAAKPVGPDLAMVQRHDRRQFGPPVPGNGSRRPA